MQAWIDLPPDWQSARARRVDGVVTRQVPNARGPSSGTGPGTACPARVRGRLLQGPPQADLLRRRLPHAPSPEPLATEPQRVLDVREVDKPTKLNSPVGRGKPANCPAEARPDTGNHMKKQQPIKSKV